MPSYRCLYKLNCNAVNKRLLKVLSNSSNSSNVCFMRYHVAPSNNLLFYDSTHHQQDKRFNLYKNKIVPTSLSNYNLQRHFSISSVKYSAVPVNDSDIYFNNSLAVSDDTASAIKYIDPEVTNLTNQDVPLQLAEPSFSSIGLGGWTPPGLVQSGMEYLHITCGLPWWGCIVCGTVIIRLAVLPLVIKFQKNISIMNNAMPRLQELQSKVMKARMEGNLVDAARYTSEMTDLIRTKDINPLKSLAIPLIQMPFFLSFFFGLRGMADLPVESLRCGGVSWFTDLTIPDPYYLLPVITCSTLLLTVELGLDTGVSVNQVQIKAMKYVLRAMPFLMFPILINFPGIILVYWLSTNVISLVQMNVLRTPSIRTFFGIESPAKPKPIHQIHATVNPGFSDGFRESLTNLKISHEMMEREALEKDTREKKEKEILELQNRLRKLKEDLATKK